MHMEEVPVSVFSSGVEVAEVLEEEAHIIVDDWPALESHGEVRSGM